MTTEPSKSEARSVEPDAPEPIKLPKILKKMLDNPKADWRIEQFKTVADKIGLSWRPPSNGSHYVFWSDHFEGNWPVPYKRPIKPIYVKYFTALCQNHMEADAMKGDDDE